MPAREARRKLKYPYLFKKSVILRGHVFRFIPGEMLSPGEPKRPIGPSAEEIAAIRVSRVC